MRFPLLAVGHRKGYAAGVGNVRLRGRSKDHSNIRHSWPQRNLRLCDDKKGDLHLEIKSGLSDVPRAERHEGDHVRSTGARHCGEQALSGDVAWTTTILTLISVRGYPW